MNWVNIRTGYSFKSVFGHLDEIMKIMVAQKSEYAGIADINGTFGHVRWKKVCKNAGINPVYGVRLSVVDDLVTSGRSPRFRQNMMTFIASTPRALHEMYHLVDLAHQQFFHIPMLTYTQVNETTNELTLLSGTSPELGLITRPFYLQMSPDLPVLIHDAHHQAVACLDNWYPKKKDKMAYETFAANQFSMERKCTPMHILDDHEWLTSFGDTVGVDLDRALTNRDVIANVCSGVELPVAPFISVGPDAAKILKSKCKASLRSQPDLHSSKMKKRLKKELDLIIEKKFSDYFLVVEDLVAWAKTKMAVGPGRGSSAGSLVCYLLGITTINPLEYNLLFERFIDINRTDLPDIDLDFQDDKRHLAIDYLKQKYGLDNVAQIGNVSKLKPKSAINRAAKALHVALYEVDEFKNSIQERPEGDARERFAIQDAMKDTELGQIFKRQFPGMTHVKRLEGHPSHSSVHAGGVLVCTEPISKFCSINSRDKNQRVAMIDKRDAEELNLLKIDALGLKTLSILAAVCDQLEKPYSWLEKIPLNKKKVYNLINSGDLVEVFQMDGASLRGLAEQITLKTLDDLAALSALCRPGPLMSGAANRYISQKKGDRAVTYMTSHPAFRKWTEDTLGNLVYQEQIMGVCREMGGMSWPDVIKVRKLMGKSMGDEAFSGYKKTFLKGCKKNGVDNAEALQVWEAMKNFGKYGFNKSHAIAYAVISYLTAYMKTFHPMEFAVAILNNSDNVMNGIKLLRGLEKRGIYYKAIDPEKSQAKWTVQDGFLVGGLMSIDGIAEAGARTILKCRKTGAPLPAGLQNKLDRKLTPFISLYPAREIYGKYYKKKKKTKHHDGWSKAKQISKIHQEGDVCFIGMLVKKTVKNINSPDKVAERDGVIKPGQEQYVTCIFEDDTGTMTTIIPRKEYEKAGKEFLEQSQENKDWFYIKGKYVDDGFQGAFVKTITRITVENHGC